MTPSPLHRPDAKPDVLPLLRYPVWDAEKMRYPKDVQPLAHFEMHHAAYPFLHGLVCALAGNLNHLQVGLCRNSNFVHATTHEFESGCTTNLCTRRPDLRQLGDRNFQVYAFVRTSQDRHALRTRHEFGIRYREGYHESDGIFHTVLAEPVHTRDDAQRQALHDQLIAHARLMQRDCNVTDHFERILALRTPRNAKPLLTASEFQGYFART